MSGHYKVGLTDAQEHIRNYILFHRMIFEVLMLKLLNNAFMLLFV